MTGRRISATNPIQASVAPCSRTNIAGSGVALIRSTRLPTQASSATSISDPISPTTTSRTSAGQIGLRKYQ